MSGISGIKMYEFVRDMKTELTNGIDLNKLKTVGVDKSPAVLPISHSAVDVQISDAAKQLYATLVKK